MQLNYTYYRAIKAILYKVVFNRKPNYKRILVGNREIDEDDIKEEEINNKANNSIIAKGIT